MRTFLMFKREAHPMYCCLDREVCALGNTNPRQWCFFDFDSVSFVLQMV